MTWQLEEKINYMIDPEESVFIPLGRFGGGRLKEKHLSLQLGIGWLIVFLFYHQQ